MIRKTKKQPKANDFRDNNASYNMFTESLKKVGRVSPEPERFRSDWHCGFQTPAEIAIADDPASLATSRMLKNNLSSKQEASSERAG